LPFSELVQILLYVLPGFIGLKIVYVFGIRQRRTDLEWIIWSIALSTAAFVLVSPVRDWLGLPETNPLAVVLSYPAAFLLAGILLVGWQLPVVQQQQWRLIAEPWDMAYADAISRHLQAVVELQDGREVYGDILWMGLAGEGSARSITVGSVHVSDADGKWVLLPEDQELYIPESSIRLLRLVPFEGPAGGNHQDSASS
jgi:hypothetical protein